VIIRAYLIKLKVTICLPAVYRCVPIFTSVAKIDILPAEKFEVLKAFIKGYLTYIDFCLILVNQLAKQWFSIHQERLFYMQKL